MRTSTYLASKTILKLLLVCLKFIVIWANDYTAKEIVAWFNQEYKFELNIFLNSNWSHDVEEFEEILRETETPKMVLRELQTNISEVRKFSSNHCLTVAYLNERNQRECLELLGKLLWKMHLTHILLIWDSNNENDLSKDVVFQECWEKGFVNVILWQEKQLFSYNPYPQVQTVQLPNFSAYGKRSYLKNFQRYAWIVPFFQFPPRCFSYTNRWGKLVRSGFYFNIIKLFIIYHNGTLSIYDVDMWQPNITQKIAVDYFKKNGFHFQCNSMFKDDSYDTSDTMWILNRYLIVPNAKEIKISLYILKPFNMAVWFIFLAAVVTTFCVIFLANTCRYKKSQQSSLLESIAVIYSLPFSKFRHNRVFTMFLVLINLVVTWMVTGIYNSNLSSLLVTKLYEPELKTLEDLAKTDLSIYEYSLDVEYYKKREFLPIIYSRLTWGNNSYLYHHRKNLDVDLHIYCATHEVAKYYMMQQRYLKHSKAKLLDQSLYGQSFYFSVAHRLPVLDLFNQFLLYIKESGIVHLLQENSYLDGIVSGDIKFFTDGHPNHAFTLEHFQFVFAAWIIGLFMAFLCLLLEIYCKKVRTVLKK